MGNGSWSRQANDSRYQMKRSAQTFRTPLEAWAACSRRREEADPCKLPVDPPAHEPDSKSGSKLHALQTLSRRFNVPETREAFGVRPACRRFRFMVSMRGCKTVASFHELQGRARHSLRAVPFATQRRARSNALPTHAVHCRVARPLTMGFSSHRERLNVDVSIGVRNLRTSCM